jgi:hypothetical protein
MRRRLPVIVAVLALFRFQKGCGFKWGKFTPDGDRRVPLAKAGARVLVFENAWWIFQLLSHSVNFAIKIITNLLEAFFRLS